MMDDTYSAFTEDVATAGTWRADAVEKIAQGRVWTGAQAQKIGLVDEVGGIDRALALAKQLAKICPKTSVRIERLPEEVPWWKSCSSAKAGQRRECVGSWAAFARNPANVANEWPRAGADGGAAEDSLSCWPRRGDGAAALRTAVDFAILQFLQGRGTQVA